MNVDCLMEIASNKASKQLSFDLRNYDLYYENMPRHSELALVSRDHMSISASYAHQLGTTCLFCSAKQTTQSHR